MLKRSALVAAAATAIAGFAPLDAQVLNSTGTGNWDVCWGHTVAITAGVCSASTSTIAEGTPLGWYSAAIIDANPGGWASDPLDGASYIGALSSGSVEPNVSGEAPNYTYTFRTNLGFADYTGRVQVDLTTFYLDNYWIGWSFDGETYQDWGISPGPLGPTGQNWRTEFQLAAYEDLANYNGDFYLRITGNGRTDGILASGRVSVPEPGTMALLFGGLMGLGLVARRRREHSA